MPHSVCPVWVGYLLVSPIRKLLHNPRAILAPYVSEGMTVVDVGSAMGFFSIPLAQMVGARGHVICVDMQEKMLQRLARRAEMAGVSSRIETRLCDQHTLAIGDLSGKADLAVAFFVVHEVPDHPRLFAELAAALKPQAKLVVAEPRGHVSAEAFDLSLVEAQKHGFTVVDKPRIRHSQAVVLQKT